MCYLKEYVVLRVSCMLSKYCHLMLDMRDTLPLLVTQKTNKLRAKYLKEAAYDIPRVPITMT